MSVYFPEGRNIQPFPGVSTSLYALDDPAGTVVMINEVAPGAVVPQHVHDEHQIGLCLRGGFIMEIDGRDFQSTRSRRPTSRQVARRMQRATRAERRP